MGSKADMPVVIHPLIQGIFDTAFPKGLELTFNSQMLRVKASSLSPQLENETHLIDILSVTFSVIA